ncbi:hypothetical protein YC2023_084936 [Brassica napus]
MFNEPQLLIVFRAALEIEMVYEKDRVDGVDDVGEIPRFTIDEAIELQPGFPLSPDDPANFDENDNVLHGEPMTIEELDRAFPNIQGPPNVHQATGLPEPPSGELTTLPLVWGVMTEEQAYWNQVMEEEANYANEDGEASYTGSSDGINENENIITLTPMSQQKTIDTPNNKKVSTVTQVGSSGYSSKATRPHSPDVEVVGENIANTRISEPCLDLTLGLRTIGNEGGSGTNA